MITHSSIHPPHTQEGLPDWPPWLWGPFSYQDLSRAVAISPPKFSSETKALARGRAVPSLDSQKTCDSDPNISHRYNPWKCTPASFGTQEETTGSCKSLRPFPGLHLPRRLLRLWCFGLLRGSDASLSRPNCPLGSRPNKNTRHGCGPGSCSYHEPLWSLGGRNPCRKELLSLKKANR